MHFLFPTVGSAGDIHPLIPLGQALQKRGHQVTIITNGYHQTVIQQSGLSFIEFGTAAELEQIMTHPDMWHPQRGFDLLVRDGFLRNMRPLYKILQNYQNQKVVVAASFICFGARIAQEKLNLPLVTLALQPSVLWSVESPSVFGEAQLPAWTPYPLRKHIFNLLDTQFLDQRLKPGVNAFRADFGLPPVQNIYSQWMMSPQKIIGLFPPWYSPPPSDWPSQLELTGFVRYDRQTKAQLSPQLTTFLQDGPPPLVFTPGTAMKQGESFFQVALQATQALNQRAIFLTPHRHQIPGNLPPTIRHFDYIPFSEVLPHVALLIHHGGIGTVAQALAAGIPQLIMPMGFDQPDNAARIKRLGVGDFIWPRNFHPPQVTKALKKLLSSPEIHACCQTFAQKVNFQTALTDTGLALESFAERVYHD